MYEITQRLYLTQGGAVVPDGHPDARWLYKVPGARITLEEAERMGLLDPEPEPEPVPATNKELIEAIEAAGGEAPTRANKSQLLEIADQYGLVDEEGILLDEPRPPAPVGDQGPEATSFPEGATAGPPAGSDGNDPDADAGDGAASQQEASDA